MQVREVRKLAEGGRQFAIVSTHYGPEARRLAALLFARRSREDYFRYMRQHYGLDALVEYWTEAMPDTAFTVSPARRKLEAEVKQKNSQLSRSRATLAAASLEQPISEFRFTRLLPEREYFLDTIKMIGYQAEIPAFDTRLPPAWLRGIELR